MIFTTKNNELAILGQTLSDFRKKLIDFNEIWMQGGRFGSNKLQLIPEENLIKELSFDEAKNKLDNFTNIVIKGNKTLDEYFAMFPENNDVLRTYVTTTDQQNQSTQGLIRASQDARAAQIAQNEAIQASTLSAKAGQLALRGLAIAGNMIAMWVVSKVIQSAAKAIDNYIHRVEKAREALEESTSAYESTTSELESLNQQLDETSTKMSELESGGITIVNEDEYNRLVETNKELERNIALKKIKQESNANQSATDAADLYQEMTKNAGTPSKEHYEKLVNDGNFTALMLDTNDASNNIDVLLAYYTHLQNKISDTKTKIDELQDSNDEGSKPQLQELQYQLEDYETTLSNVFELITENMDKYQEIYDGIKPKIDLDIDLTDEEQKAYEAANTALNLINYVFSSPSKRLEDFVSKNSLSDALTDLFTSGKSEAAIKALLNSYYPQLLAFMSQEGISIQDLADKYTNLAEANQEAADEGAKLPATISSSVSQLAVQLEPQFTQLGEAYKAIFTDDGFTLSNIDTSMLEELRKSFAEMEDAGIDFDAAQLDTFFNALTTNYRNAEDCAQQVQQAFNDLATSYFYSTDTLDQLNAETADAVQKQLEELGVQNAQTVVAEALTAKTEELFVQKQYLAETGKELSSATDEEAAAFIAEQIAAGNCGEALALLQIRKFLCNENWIDSASDISNLLTLANAAGIASDALGQMNNLKMQYDATDNPHAKADIAAKMENLKSTVEAEFANVKIDFGSIGGRSSSTGKAGSEAADAYLEAFEDELADLEDLRDRGTIDESTYLKRLRALYQRYFKDRKEYIDEYNKYERQYLEGMKSLYESALSGITKLLSNKIDGYSDAKESAVKALEAEKQAAEDAYQAQIDAIDDVIDSKQDIIDGIQNEIDAMRDANEERQREIDLEKAKYELERLQNQKTNFVYRSGEGFLYENDPSAVRDAKQSVEDAELEIKIAAKEKEIDLIEKEIDALEKQKDAIQKLMDESSKYYESMISQTEAYWDSIINSLEQQKSKWEELAEIESVAEAYSAIKQVFGDLGYTVEDVLNGSSGAFEDFRSKYVELLSDLNSNDSFANGLSYAAGVVEENLGSFTDKAKEIADSISDLGNAGSDLESLSSSMENIGTSSTIAAEGTKGTASGMSELCASASDASESLNSISTILEEISGADNILDLAGAFERLAGALGTVNKALGIGEGETTEGGLAGTLAKLTQLSIEGDPSGNGSGGLSEQFQKLKSSIAAVSSALTGSGAGSDPDSPGESEGAGGGSSLTTALETLKTTADAVLGNGIGKAADPDGETAGSGNGLIGQFSQVKENVTAISAAIGTEESGEKKEGNLIGSLSALDEKSNEILGEPGGEGVIGDFEKMQEPLKDANEHVAGIAESLAEIDGQKVECTITVHMETTGNTSAAYFLGTAGSHMNLKSASYTAFKGPAGVNGTAFATGNWAVQSSGYQALVGELGYEIIVRNGRFFTVGNTGAEFVPIQRGDIVFNHEQSRQLLKYGHISGRGKAYADGTVGNPLASGKYVPLPVNHPEMELSRTLQTYMEKIGGSIRNIVAPSVNSIQKDMTRMVNHVQNVNNNSRCDQPLTVQIGDIHLHEVQNTDGLAKAIVSRLPAMVMQEIHKR